MKLRRTWFPALLALALAAALTFLTLPVVAIFVDRSPGDLIESLGEEGALDALWLSLRTTAISMLIIVAVGTPAAYLLATRSFRGKAVVVTLIELPLVLPPAVAGIALFAAFGRMGLLGEELDAFGVQIPFTQAAVVLAVAFVESPFYFRGAIAAFETVDDGLIDAARTLGAGPARVFARVALPLAAGGLGAASALALARGLGEFGATIIFAGSLQGVTQTLPLAVYAQFEQDFDTALAISALFIVVGAVLLVSLKLYPWFRFASIFRSRFAASTSA
jgi:molybdate transport system permease protein